MTRNVRRVAAGAILIAVGCNVYDPSLLVGNGDTSGGTGGTDVQGGTGAGGTGGSTGGSGATGGSTGGAPLVGGAGGGGGVEGGTGGTTAGRAGAGGTSAGSGGTDNTAGEAGEAGMMGEAGAGATGGTGGSGGSAGSSGSGGSAGTGAGGMQTGGSSGAGMGGTAGMSGGGGSAGSSAGMAGAGGSGTRMGCAALTVPLTAASDKAHFDISFTSPVDMSASSVTITMDLYVASGAGGIIDLFVQDSSSFHFLNPAPANISTIASFVGAGWKTMSWNVGTEDPRSTGIAMDSIKRVGVEIAGANATNPAPAKTVVYIDSIAVSLAAPQSFEFGASGSISTTAGSTDPMNSNAMWLNNYSADTTDPTNTKIAWQATCP